MWFLKRADGVRQRLIRTPYNYLEIAINSGNNLDVYMTDTTNTKTFEYLSSTAITGTAWHHLAVSWNTNFSAGNKLLQVYLDGALFAGTLYDGSPAFSYNWATDTLSPEGESSSNLDQAETYLDIVNKVDLSANLGRFISGGKPVYLGDTGSLPSGSQPAVYLSNPAASRGTNKGYGGSWSITGTPTDTTGPY